MAFGEGFKREKELPIASEGEHLVRLVKISEKFKDEWHFMEFQFEYLDKVPRNPNKFCLFAPKFGSGEQGQHAFNVQATRIMDCFGLKGGFDEENRKSWINATGKIALAKDKNGYMNVKKFIPHDTETVKAQDPATEFWG